MWNVATINLVKFWGFDEARFLFKKQIGSLAKYIGTVVSYGFKTL